MGLSDCQPDAGREVRRNVVCDGREVKHESNLVFPETTGFQMSKVNKSE